MKEILDTMYKTIKSDLALEKPMLLYQIMVQPYYMHCCCQFELCVEVSSCWLMTLTCDMNWKQVMVVEG